MLLGENSRTVAAAVHERIAGINRALPPDIRARTVLNRLSLVDATIATVARNLVEGAILVIVVLVLIVWSVKRRRRPHIRVEHFSDTDALMQSISGFTQGTVVTGNSVRLVENGKYFDELFEAIRGAQKSVSIETFLAKEGKVTSDLAELLAKNDQISVADIERDTSVTTARTSKPAASKPIASSALVASYTLKLASSNSAARCSSIRSIPFRACAKPSRH